MAAYVNVTPLSKVVPTDPDVTATTPVPATDDMELVHVAVVRSTNTSEVHATPARVIDTRSDWLAARKSPTIVIKVPPEIVPAAGVTEVGMAA
jgi:hypothetical protein